MKVKTLVFGLLALTFSCHLQAKINVVATTADLGALARDIGGERVDVTTLAKPTEDPHFVDAKPSFKVKLNRADALIYGGAELESGWLTPLLDGARNPRLQPGKPGLIVACEGVVLRDPPATLDRSKGDLHASGNPHFLSDPKNAKIVAEHICSAFARIEASSADFFRANFARFNRDLEQKSANWDTTLKPYQGRGVVAYHDSWVYFAQRFGLRINLFLEPRPGIPPTPAHLAEVITQMKREQVRVIIVQPFQNRKLAETAARHAEATVLDFPLFPTQDQSYLEWIDSLVSSLEQAFAKATPARQ